MPGFWDYFQQMTDSANQKQMALQDRQMNIANMWMQSAARDAGLAQSYMGIKQGLLGTRAQTAIALDERDRWNKNFENERREFSEKFANEKYQFGKGLEEAAENRKLEQARINKMGASNGNDYSALQILLNLIKQNGLPGLGSGGALDDVEVKAPQTQQQNRNQPKTSKKQIGKQPGATLAGGFMLI